MNDQNSSNKAKTPLANVSSGKDNSLDADVIQVLENLRNGMNECWCPNDYQEDQHWGACLAAQSLYQQLTNPITQAAATASAPTTTVTDHSPAAPPDVYERLRNACNYTWGVGNESVLNDPRYMTWHDQIQHYCDRNNLTEQDNEFFSSLLTEVILACSTTVPDKGSVQHETESDGMFSTNVDVYAPTKDFWGTPESESSTLAEIRERRAALDPQDAKGDRCYECSYDFSRHSPSVVKPCVFHADAPTDIDTLLGIIDSLKAENDQLKKDYDLVEGYLDDIKRELGFEPNIALGMTLDRYKESVASNMKAEIVKRVREKAAEWDAMGVSTQNVLWGRKADAAREVATEIEAIEVKDDPYPCPRCGAPDTTNFATPPEVSIGCRECGWEAVTIKEQEK